MFVDDATDRVEATADARDAEQEDSEIEPEAGCSKADDSGTARIIIIHFTNLTFRRIRNS